MRNLTLGLVVVAAVALAGCSSNSATPAPVATTVPAAVESIEAAIESAIPDAIESIEAAIESAAPAAVATVAPDAVESALPAGSPAA